METINPTTSTQPAWRGKLTKPGFVYTVLSLTVLLPMLLPGYIFALDMTFTPEIRLPEHVTSSYLFYAVLHVLNVVIPSQLLQKVLLFVILFVSGLGAYKLIKQLYGATEMQEHQNWGAYIGGALYMINPFTYSRFMVGQFAVLLGYALLPWFVRSLLNYLARPGTRTVGIMTAWAVGISIVSIHTIGLLAILLFVGAFMTIWQQRKDTDFLKGLAESSLMGLGIFLFASCYWLMPLLTGTNTTAQALQGFTSGDRQAFATLGATMADKIGNVLQLQGFWAEARNLYVLPQHRLALWGIAATALIALAITGAAFMWKQRQRRNVLLFGASGIIAIILATSGILATLSEHITVLAGYREPQKFIGLLALAYAVFVGFAISGVLGYYTKRQKPTDYSVTLILFLILPVLLTPTMFWGFGGQLKAHAYPADWQMVNKQMGTDQNTQTLFLPWHLYMSYRFAGRIIGSPAESFFDKPTVVNNNLELGSASPTVPNAEKTRLNTILKHAEQGTRLGHQLAKSKIEYVLLTKENDFAKYTYLDRQTDLHLIADTTHFRLYRNDALGGN